jgi:ribosomal protein L22
MTTNKKCCRCKEEKTIEQFVKNRPECKACKREISRKWAEDNSEKNLLMQKVHYWKAKSKQLEAQLEHAKAKSLGSNLFGIEGLSEIEDGLNNL